MEEQELLLNIHLISSAVLLLAHCKTQPSQKVIGSPERIKIQSWITGYIRYKTIF